MELRPFRPEDMDAVAAIADRAWRPINDAYRDAYGEELFAMLFPNPDTRVGENVRRSIESRPGQAIVVEEDGQVVAFCTYHTDKEVGVVGYNGVDPSCRHRGIAQMMYRWVFDEFRRQGMTYARVLTGLDPGHAPARRAYERAGFDRRHGTVTYYMKL